MNAALLLTLAALAPAHPRADHERDKRHDEHAEVWRAPGGGHDGYEEACPRSVDDSFAALDQALNDMADDVDRMRGRDRVRMRANLQALADAAEQAREQACRNARRGGPPVVVMPPPPPPPPPPPRAPVLENGTHEANLAAMRRENFDDGKVRILDTVFRGDICVTSKQTTDYMRQMSFSSNRLDVLRRLAPRLVNDGNAVSIYGVLDFESEKDDARKLLTSTSIIPACRLPIR